MLRSRKELTVGGKLTRHCTLCWQRGTDIEHKPDCPLRDPGITHVRMAAVRERIYVRGPRRSDGKYWWTSSNSGRTYDIERRDTYWVMHERESGKAIKDDARLSDIRQYLVDNQGVL